MLTMPLHASTVAASGGCGSKDAHEGNNVAGMGSGNGDEDAEAGPVTAPHPV